LHREREGAQHAAAAGDSRAAGQAARAQRGANPSGELLNGILFSNPMGERKAEVEELEEELDQIYSDISDELGRAEYALETDLAALLDLIDEMGRWCDGLRLPEGHAKVIGKCFELRDRLLAIYRSLCADYMRVRKAKRVAGEKIDKVFKELAELLEGAR